MIRLYDKGETKFNHNKCILKPISCYVLEEANGLFELEAELPKDIEIENGQIIKAPTPRGEQLFRVYRSRRSLKTKIVYARHIYYDLAKNFIIDCRPTNVSCFTAINDILSNTEYQHNFIALSDIPHISTAYYIRQNPIQAIMGSDNSILNTWGGNLIRDNYKITIKEKGLDRGYEIHMGKNLIGIEDDSDDSNVKTRLYPTVVLSDSDVVYTLPEKYVDSPLIDLYGDPIIYEERIELTEEEKALSLHEIYDIMRTHCQELFDIYNVDKPIINYKIDFVELSKTDQYKNYALLEQLDLYDIVTCNVPVLNINVKARVIKYTYNCLKGNYDGIELGDFRATSNYQVDGIVKQITDRIKANETAVEHATNVITGNKGGYFVLRRYPDGKPYEILIMDTEDINTAVNVLRINNSGIGFSTSGYNGQFHTAITIDSHIVADFIDTGTLTSILIKSENYIPDVRGTKINLADGSIDSKNFKVSSLGDAYFSGTVTASAIESSKFTCSNDINTIVIDPNTPESLFTISKGDDKQIWFDNEGNAVFEGHMTIGQIYSKNYVESEGEEGSMIDLETGSFKFANDRLVLDDNGLALTNTYKGNWMGLGELDYKTGIEFKDGYLKILNKTNNRDLYFIPEGISTNFDAQNATGVLSFFSKVYGNNLFGITLQTNSSPVALRSLSGNVLIHPKANVFTDNTFMFGCDDNTGEGILMFGDFPSNTYSVGLKLSKDSSDPTLYITDGTRGKITGNIAVNDLRARKLTIDTNKIKYENNTLDVACNTNINGELNVNGSSNFSDLKLNNNPVTTKTDLDTLETEWQDLLETSLQTSYNTGYSAGRTAGYNSGYNSGHSDGYSSGYSSGYSDGYSDGSSSGN